MQGRKLTELNKDDLIINDDVLRENTDSTFFSGRLKNPDTAVVVKCSIPKH